MSRMEFVRLGSGADPAESVRVMAGNCPHCHGDDPEPCDLVRVSGGHKMSVHWSASFMPTPPLRKRLLWRLRGQAGRRA